MAENGLSPSNEKLAQRTLLQAKQAASEEVKKMLDFIDDCGSILTMVHLLEHLDATRECLEYGNAETE